MTIASVFLAVASARNSRARSKLSAAGVGRKSWLIVARDAGACREPEQYDAAEDDQPAQAAPRQQQARADQREQEERDRRQDQRGDHRLPRIDAVHRQETVHVGVASARSGGAIVPEQFVPRAIALGRLVSPCFAAVARAIFRVRDARAPSPRRRADSAAGRAGAISVPARTPSSRAEGESRPSAAVAAA